MLDIVLRSGRVTDGTGAGTFPAGLSAGLEYVPGGYRRGSTILAMIDDVIVNGDFVFRHGRRTGVLSGRALRRGECPR
ncbi:hypothetical protein AB0395_06905 [Streptosporangium sp. NPDC051023]|uniref:hypothetical protein n=1 Tax=Streptosporangium sp. NPDC051023 TaxID=3155410 RepID=UPI00344CFFD9